MKRTEVRGEGRIVKRVVQGMCEREREGGKVGVVKEYIEKGYLQVQQLIHSGDTQTSSACERERGRKGGRGGGERDRGEMLMYHTCKALRAAGLGEGGRGGGGNIGN